MDLGYEEPRRSPRVIMVASKMKISQRPELRQGRNSRLSCTTLRCQVLLGPGLTRSIKQGVTVYRPGRGSWAKLTCKAIVTRIPSPSCILDNIAFSYTQNRGRMQSTGIFYRLDAPAAPETRSMGPFVSLGEYPPSRCRHCTAATRRRPCNTTLQNATLVSRLQMCVDATLYMALN